MEKGFDLPKLKKRKVGGLKMEETHPDSCLGGFLLMVSGDSY